MFPPGFEQLFLPELFDNQESGITITAHANLSALMASLPYHF